MHDRSLLDKLISGDRSALGRAITLMESRRSADREAARELLRACYGRAGNSMRIGITGIPGVRKSTLIDVLGQVMIDQGHKIAVLAIDPSSQRTGGSILGDKTRMERLSTDPNAFIRPTPTSGILGGIGRNTKEAILICEAAGYGRTLIETVGVGQSEHDVDQVCDLNVLLMIAGAGDELQGMKRGIMEAADVIVFTKADGDALSRTEAAAREMKKAISLLPARPNGRRAQVLLTSSVTGSGVKELAAHLEQLATEDRASGYFQRKRRMQEIHWSMQMVHESLIRKFEDDPGTIEMRRSLEAQIQEGHIDPIEAAERLVRRFFKD